MVGYRLNHSFDIKEVGKYPQCKTADYKSSIHDDSFIGNVTNFCEHQEIIVPDLILTKSAKPTDLISAPILGYNKKLIISERFFEFISEFADENLESLTVKVIHEGIGQTYNYVVLNFKGDQSNIIDFTKSEVVAEKRDQNRRLELETLNIKTIRELQTALYTMKSKGYDSIYINRLFFKNDITDLSLFYLTNVYGYAGYFVSENMRNQFMKHNFTGISYIPSHLTLQEWMQQ